MKVALMVRQMLDPLPIDLISHTDLDRIEGVQHVEFRQRDLAERIHPCRLTHHRSVEPAAAAGPLGIHPVFVTDRAQPFADLVVEFGRERARTHPGHVGLGDAHDAIDVTGTDSGAHTRTAGDRIGRGDVGVGAVVDVEKRRLGPLEQHVVAPLERLVNERDGVGDVGTDPRDDLGEIPVCELVGVEAQPVVDLGENQVFLSDDVGELLAEDLLVQQVLQTDSDAGGLVGIGRADAPFGRPEFVLAQVPFDQAVELLVVREDDVGIARHLQLRAVDPGRGELIHLGEHDDRVDDDTVADHRRDVGIQDPRRNELQGERLAIDDERMSRVVTALVAHHHRHFFGDQVGELALAFVAPLRSDDDRCGHACLQFR